MKFPKLPAFVFLIIILVSQVFLRLPFMAQPLNVDEATYAYFARQVSQGSVLYRDLIDQKPPAIFHLYMLFGSSELSLRLAALLACLASSVLIFLIGRLISGNRLGLWAALLYVLFSGGPLIEGASANAEVFMVLFSLAGLLGVAAAEKYSRTRYLIWGGLALGLAMMIKMVAAFNLLAVLAYSAYKRELKPGLVLLLSALLAPFFYFLQAFYKGVAPEFIYYVFIYNLGYLNPSLIFFLLRTAVIFLFENSLLWILSAIGAVYILLKDRRTPVLLVLWALFSLAGVYAGGYAFGHYYIQVIPGLSFLAAYVLVNWRGVFKRRAVDYSFRALLIVLALVILAFQLPFYLVFDTEQISDFIQGSRINIIARQIGQKIKERSGPGARIFTLGPHQVLFYAEGSSPGKYYIMQGMSAGLNSELLGKKYQKDFRVRQAPEVGRAIERDLLSSINDPRTQYVVFQRELAPRNIGQLLKGYKLDKELSNVRRGVFVLSREKTF